MEIAILVRTIVEVAAFLELADDEIVDPDAAVRQLEHIAYRMQSLPEHDQLEIRRLVAQFASEEGATDEPGHWIRFLHSFCDDIGLADRAT